MKFSCNRDDILKEISIALEIIASRNALSILSNVFLEASDNHLIIRATDLKIYFETTIPVEVHDSGKTTTICERLASILRTLPDGDIEFLELGDDHFVIVPKFKKIDFRLKTIPAEKYPEIPAVNEQEFFQISQNDFIEMITQTIFAVSDDQTRYFMNGVAFEKDGNSIVMVSTDGKRLAYIKKEFNETIPDFDQIIIPQKILGLVKKQTSGEGNISIAITEKNIFMKFDNQQISSSLIDGPFPKYRRVIPESQEHEIRVSRTELSEALRRVSLMVEKSKRIYMEISNNVLVLKSDVSDIGTAQEEIICTYDGPEMIIALNFVYLIDPLKVIQSDEVSIQFTEATKAISINAIPEKEFFHIIMPMNMNE